MMKHDDSPGVYIHVPNLSNIWSDGSNMFKLLLMVQVFHSQHFIPRLGHCFLNVSVAQIWWRMNP